jgi:hypothetical protein
MKLKLLLSIAAAAVSVCIALLSTKIDYNFDPAVEGFFILEGEKGYWLEFSDDLVPEDARRLVWAMPRYPFRKSVGASRCINSTQPCIDFTWDKKCGRGFIN